MKFTVEDLLKVVDGKPLGKWDKKAVVERFEFDSR